MLVNYLGVSSDDSILSEFKSTTCVRLLSHDLSVCIAGSLRANFSSKVFSSVGGLVWDSPKASRNGGMFGLGCECVSCIERIAVSILIRGS